MWGSRGSQPWGSRGGGRPALVTARGQPESPASRAGRAGGGRRRERTRPLSSLPLVISGRPPTVSVLGLNGFLPLRSATAATAPPAAPAGEGGPPAPPPNLTSNRRLQQTQAQVDEVVDIMRVNVDKVLERDQKLSELDDRADALQAGASQFETSAAKLKRKYWWKNLKMMIILGVICAIILIIIIVYFSS
ncbi:PREDICTED: vesicle-associated membrane protein 2 [Ceratotherium simum simum]|uniref:Vesicle-associated membrane protein 2 n=1 Tax=Ceratotherium simum simum TaxID=73337 RepID=A0ABM1D0F2_CERSS|nr:PREDICTED: vesicle-associated membrane protein 2 [Ceratotherium simum simum]